MYRINFLKNSDQNTAIREVRLKEQATFDFLFCVLAKLADEHLNVLLVCTE